MILLRSALFNAWFFGITALIGLYGAIIRFVAPARAIGVARAWATAVLGGARVICGIHVDVSGLEHIPPGPSLIVSQHQSAFDTLIWAMLLPDFSYIYKAELERIPLFGPMLPAAGQIAVQRKASVASLRQLLAGVQRAKAQSRRIIIFPEGTRVAHGEVAALRGGFTMLAARADLRVIPVATDSGRYWGRRAFRKYPGRIQIRVGAPIDATLPPDVLTARLRESWALAWNDDPVDKSVDRTATEAKDRAGTSSPAE